MREIWNSIKSWQGKSWGRCKTSTGSCTVIKLLIFIQLVHHDEKFRNQRRKMDDFKIALFSVNSIIIDSTHVCQKRNTHIPLSTRIHTFHSLIFVLFLFIRYTFTVFVGWVIHLEIMYLILLFFTLANNYNNVYRWYEYWYLVRMAWFYWTYYHLTARQPGASPWKIAIHRIKTASTHMY